MERSGRRPPRSTDAGYGPAILDLGSEISIEDLFKF